MADKENDRNETVTFDPTNKIASLTLNYYSHPSVGAAARIIVTPNPEIEKQDEKKFWDMCSVINGIVKELNSSPDDYPLVYDEMSMYQREPYSSSHNTSGNRWGCPSYRGRHEMETYEGTNPYKSCHIRHIEETDLPNVAAKLVRRMAVKGLLKPDEVEKAHVELKLPDKVLRSQQEDAREKAVRGRW